MTAPLRSAGRELWRLHGPTRVVTAHLYPHAHGTELRVFFEPTQSNEVLARHVGDVGELERRAATVRQALVQNGWIELGTHTRVSSATPRQKVGVAGAISVIVGVGWWLWRRRGRRRAPATAAH